MPLFQALRSVPERETLHAVVGRKLEILRELTVSGGKFTVEKRTAYLVVGCEEQLTLFLRGPEKG